MTVAFSRPTEADRFLQSAPVVATYPAPTDDDRGSGRIWYALRLGGWAPVTYPDGSENREYGWASLTVPVTAGLGFADTLTTLRATAAAHCPGMELVEWWVTEEPAAEF